MNLLAPPEPSRRSVRPRANLSLQSRLDPGCNMPRRSWDPFPQLAYILAWLPPADALAVRESALGRFWLACINRWRRILVYRLGYIGGFGRSRSARYILRGSNHWISRKFYCLEVRRGRYRLNGHYFGSITCFR